MDPALFEILAVPISSITVVDLTFKRWGCDWYIDCIYDEHRAKKHFQIALIGCEQITIQGNPSTTQGDLDADVIGIELGIRKATHEFYIVTGEFEAHAKYQKIEIYSSESEEENR